MKHHKRWDTLWRTVAAIALGFHPTGIFAFDPFTLYSQVQAPKKSRIVTRVEPGDQSLAAKNSCKDPEQIKRALKHRTHLQSNRQRNRQDLSQSHEQER
jgi:hypothetical protein